MKPVYWAIIIVVALVSVTWVGRWLWLRFRSGVQGRRPLLDSDAADRERERVHEHNSARHRAIVEAAAADIAEMREKFGDHD